MFNYVQLCSISVPLISNFRYAWTL